MTEATEATFEWAHRCNAEGCKADAVAFRDEVKRCATHFFGTAEPMDVEAFARRLVAEGWESTSNRYRNIARLSHEARAENLIRPEVLNTPLGRELAFVWKRWHGQLLRTWREPYVEQLTLSDYAYRVFRRCGGHSAF